MLPIDELIPGIVASLHAHPNLVIQAEPGAGKTTRVPPALLALGGEVVVLEPRRIAARMAARRVASEINERVGETVGYQVRFEESTGSKTRLRFVTEGILTRRLISDPDLRGVNTVVLDEFHERHLETDLALALLRRLQKTKRPDLRIAIMSATLDAEPVARFLGGCPVVKSKGRLFDLEISHLPYSAAPLEEQVASAAENALRRGGDMLVFLPGAAEIRKAARACESLALRRDCEITPLYGDLSPAEQDRAVEPSRRQKLILSTNIAESSITIEGVRTVIDSGLARIAGDSPWTGLPTLDVKRISKASARQRAGRAARTAPGEAIRLYSADDFQRRPEHDVPEILRRELSQMCLHLEAAAIHDPASLEWLDAPPEAALRAAEDLLTKLGARGKNAADLARIPLPPRLAVLLRRGGEPARKASALLSSGQRVQSTDLPRALDEPWDQRTRMVYNQLAPFSNQRRVSDREFAQAVLAAFPDRVGRVRSNGVVLLSNGSAAKMAAAPGEFLVALDVEERGDKSGPIVRLACAIEPEWLLDRAIERTTLEWNRQAERVESVSAILYNHLVIEETRGPCTDDRAAAAFLAAKVAEAGIDRFVDAEVLNELLARVEFAEMSVPTADEIVAALAELSYGARSLADVEKAAAGLIATLEARCGSQLEQLAPSKLWMPSGRVTRIHYEHGKPPWAASRLQDFFGMIETPRIGRRRTPLVVHLLAPNRRPVQTTADLAGFWARLYPQLRRELGRRYPKHAWPEKP